MRSALLLLLLAGPAWAVPQDAVVRLSSHGGSGTVIYTEAGHSWVLSCGHCFESEREMRTTIRVQAPDPAPGGKRRAAPRLVAVDHRLDLSLIELSYGPMPYVCPVAERRHVPGWLVVSVGYDRMKEPATDVEVHVLSSGGGLTYTRERPIPGRSGGGLLDLDGRGHGVLIGVCQGYENLPLGRGMYVSLDAVCDFLARQGWGAGSAPKPLPGGLRIAAPFEAAPAPECNH